MLKKLKNKSWILRGVNGVYFGQRPILHPCFVETCSIVLVVILLTSQQTDTGENITSMEEVKLQLTINEAKLYTQNTRVQEINLLGKTQQQSLRSTTLYLSVRNRL